ncbi:MAG: futalosine hydrolase [Saprospiraceae bacterium]|nr:futalosine hydrolase [Saprospiraceae bacterium]
MKKILVVSATVFEIQPFLDFLKNEMAVRKSPLFAQYAFDILITGVGMVNTAMKVTKALAVDNFDFALNVGIAGVFPQKMATPRTPAKYIFELGQVVEVVSERYGDLGVEEATGAFTDMFELGLMEANEMPFFDGKLLNNKPLSIPKMPIADGLTVQKVHGYPLSIRGVLQKYKDVQIETMEGAAFFQVCLSEGIAFAQIRAISNYVEARNRENWQIKEAIEQLNKTLVKLFVDHKI